MTLGFFLLTGGVALIYTGFKNMSLADLALGRPGPGQPADIAGASEAGAAVGANAAAVASGAGKGADIDRRISGVGSWRGTPVAKWMIPILTKAEKAGWDGCLTSGYRTPAYSESLCYDMCGARSCSGTCAGKSSNHSGKRFPGGAIDVCNPSSFQSAMNKIGNPLKNSLGAADPVHFSVSGR